ncbi:dihydroxyacetone kinase subunit DhaK [Arsenicicoccus piscis]|uniref:Dihydroxyacetone kinase n=1 Tax=Arsenicicoccus piscis TaxID=673954 RepID=A0ABQ6HUY6_9MICO|nr:dihydroxyacetone kinase subunit DhaK [Arsenicicoccus piscis]MCH8627355.1 dihydroxyacetone kinase subunit DhaK [Arsenicicoccus piscis]GMA21503.1 dihydroxyacetone kinase [Arsenicicoccus piscis]GMA22178.1 dihydroxyacetone kinase [Arsenicicoccus piscis]GMA22226.1 dihydroxyacetone kinase [Arsenicicoccus piscis]
MRRQVVNDPDQMVAEALEGLALSHPDLVRYDPRRQIVTRRHQATDKVALLSGGGSGHEPLHAGFVGVGMLDVAVPGAIFASPTALQLHEGTLAADNGQGVLHIVKNYTGDVLNFTIARELADDDGVRTAEVLVDDDLATDSNNDDTEDDEEDDGGPGRRGTAAVVAVEKLCGAAAEASASLDELAQLGADVVKRSSTLAFALEAGTHPGQDRAGFDLEAGEVEFGVGIHGERGRSRIDFAAADDLVAHVVDPLVESLGLARGDAVLAIVNDLGSAYPLETYVAARAMHRQLDGRGVTVARSLVGPYVTSLDMHGLSITLVRVDDDLLRLWDAPVHTPALTWGGAR